MKKILIDWEGLFHDINLKNNDAIVPMCGKVRTSFGDIGETFTLGHPTL